MRILDALCTFFSNKSPADSDSLHYMLHQRDHDAVGYIGANLRDVRTPADQEMSKKSVFFFYSRDCLPDDAHFWPEFRILCDFVRDFMTSGEMV